MPRLGYSKSRKGCRRCKQRRVKCDERAPACAACVRHGLPCSLGDIDTDTTSQGTSPSSHTHTPRASSHSHVDSNPFPYLSNLVRSHHEAPDFHTRTADLELMHHYTAVTWRTFPRAEEMADIWQLQVPRIGLTHDYLMHQLLAISAAHLAYLHRDDQDRRNGYYSLRATQHQNAALQRLQGCLPEIDEATCPAIFLTSSLLSIGAFAMLSESASQGPGAPETRTGIEELLHVLLLLRGMYEILHGFHDVLKASVIGNMIWAGNSSSNSPLLAEIMDELTDLRLLPSRGDNRDPAADRILREAMDSMMYWIRQASGAVELPEMRVIMTWPTKLGDGFMGLLRARNRDALRVMACYARILEALGPTHWYLARLGESLLADIEIWSA